MRAEMDYIRWFFRFQNMTRTELTTMLNKAVRLAVAEAVAQRNSNKLSLIVQEADEDSFQRIKKAVKGNGPLRILATRRVRLDKAEGGSVELDNISPFTRVSLQNDKSEQLLKFDRKDLTYDEFSSLIVDGFFEFRKFLSEEQLLEIRDMVDRILQSNRFVAREGDF